MGQPSTTDTLIFDLSKDAYKGDAQLTVTIDGKPLGAAQTVTASHVDLGLGIEARRVVRAKTLVSFTG